MKYYLAYGSNLNLEQMARRCPYAIPVGTAELNDYRLLFRGSKSGNYLTVERKKGRMVPLLVWAISDSDEKNLDRYEGCPVFYRKEIATVRIKDFVTGDVIRTVDGLIYIMNPGRPLGKPYSWYFDTCMEGYDRFGFDQTYLYTAIDESDL